MIAWFLIILLVTAPLWIWGAFFAFLRWWDKKSPSTSSGHNATSAATDD